MCSEEMCILLSGHMDGFNTPEQEAALQAHLAQCEDCRRTLAEYQRNDKAIADLTKAPPGALCGNVMRAVRSETPRPEKQQRRFPMRYATAIAAVAAVFLLVISTGKVSLPHAGATAIHPDAPAQTIYEVPVLPQAVLSASSEQSAELHAHVDCAALARTEGIPVAVLYTDDTPAVLASAPALALSGGVRYTVTQGTVEAIAADYDGLIVYEPDQYTQSDSGSAYLIVIPVSE